MAILDRFRKKTSDEKPKTDKKEDVKPAKKAAASKASKKTTKKTSKPAAATKKEKQTGETIVGNVSHGESLSYRLLLKPHVSEKAARLADQGVYVFDVKLEAEKVAVKKAVEAMYNVEVEKVRMVRGIGKPLRRGRKMSRRKSWKKALVQVKKGQTIDLYEGV